MPAQRAAVPPQVVIGCAPEDLAAVRALTQRLRADGLSPWLVGDELPQQRDQARTLREVVRGAIAVVICLSRRSWSGATLSPGLANLLDVVALAPRRPQLIALKLTSCDLPPDLQGATVLELLRYSGYGQLLAAIGAQIAKPAPPAPPAPAPAAPITPLLALRGRFAQPNLERQGHLRRLGRGVARGVWLLDGNRALVIGGGGAALLDLRDGAPIWTIDNPTRCAALSPNGRLLALAGNSLIVLWDLQDGQLKTTYSGHTAAVGSLAFAPDARTLASAGGDATLRLWRVDLEQPRQAPLVTMSTNTDHTPVIAFSPSGALLAAGGTDRTVRIWRTLDRALVQQLTGLGGAIEALAFSPDGTLLAAGSRGRSARVWATRSWQTLYNLDAHDGAVEALAFSPDGAALATGAGDQRARLWRIADGALTRMLADHSGPVSALAFSPDGAALATLSSGHLLVWGCADGAQRAALRPLSARTTSLAFSPDGALLAVGSADGHIAIYPLADDGPPQLRQAEHRGPITGLAFAGTRRLLSTAADRTVRECRTDTGASVIMLQTHSAIQSVTLAPGGRLLACSDGESTVQLWRLSEPDANPGGQFWRVLRGLRSRARLVCFAPQADLIAVAGDDGGALIWRFTSSTPEEPVLHVSAGARLRSLAISPDSGLLAGGVEGGAIKIWRLSDGADMGASAGDGRSITSLAFAPDGRTLTAGDTTGQIQIWRIPIVIDKRRRPPTPASSIDAHAGAVEQLVYSPDGSILASGAADGVVRLWRV